MILNAIYPKHFINIAGKNLQTMQFNMNSQKLFYILALQNVSNIGDITAKKLIHHCGSAEAVFKEKDYKLKKIDGIGTTILKDLFSHEHFQNAELELKYIEENNISCLYFQDEDYPERLKHCIDGPILLFQRGKINLKKKRTISVVGTRQITTYGIDFCKKLIQELKPFDPVIISGFAYGTDIVAQKEAMKQGLQTIGCLAHGLNQIYPKTHSRYVRSMEDHGGFFTDFWSSDTFDRTNFLKRNRIIAGLSEATIVIESAEKGGSLVTADIADSYNRDVFAVPGRATDTLSMGCNNLIKQQKAHVLTHPLDVAYMLNWQIDEVKPKPVQKQLFVELDSTEKKVYSFLKDNDKQLLDIIALNCNLPVFQTASVLLGMELKGVIRPLPGKLFELT